MEKNRRVEAVRDPAAANIPLEHKGSPIYRLHNRLLENSSTASFVKQDYIMEALSFGTVCTLSFRQFPKLT